MYRRRFEKMGVVSDEGLLELLPDMFFDEDNSMLCKIPPEKEIEASVMAMSPSSFLVRMGSVGVFSNLLVCH